jgi:hypothetical protein
LLASFVIFSSQLHIGAVCAGAEYDAQQGAAAALASRVRPGHECADSVIEEGRRSHKQVPLVNVRLQQNAHKSLLTASLMSKP